MLRTRVIPALLLRDESLVKTTAFDRYSYIGDPCNTVRIFNELEVDELIFLDIRATVDGRSPNLRVLAEIADECFMPLGYGGGIRTIDDVKAILSSGFEKVVLNSHALADPTLITRVADQYGSQAVILSIDVRRDLLGRQRVYAQSAKKATHYAPVDWAKEAEARGAGELLLTSVEREGSWSGFDLDLIRSVTDAVNIPVVAHGGGGSLADIGRAVKDANASAVALGSMVVFQKKGMGVLVNFPDERALSEILADR